MKAAALILFVALLPSCVPLEAATRVAVIASLTGGKPSRSDRPVSDVSIVRCIMPDGSAILTTPTRCTGKAVEP